MEFKNDLFLRTARGEQIERPPVWLMRQAGRILPQYRALRANVDGFIALVKNPELAAEVTIQPVDELGVDAAIIFSDILVIPEAMGLPYKMVESVGPRFPKTVTSATDVDGLLSGKPASDTLEYVYEAVKTTKAALDGRVPLIGFSGSPWTLFAYMIEGGGSKTFSKAKKMLYTEPELSHRLLAKITETIISYLKDKISVGVDLVQLFDSWAGILSPTQYATFASPYIAQICDAIDEVPITVFSKGAWFALEEIGQMNCAVVGVDWNTNPAEARKRVGEGKVLQGNLDPCQLYASPESIRKQTIKMLQSFGNKHIANLGHGVYPDTPLDNVRVFVDTVQAYSYK
jgi:uroporphyrinogen decarboxylase